MSSYRISDEEREALRGLPLAARVLYVEGLRPHMDYRTGEAGEQRRITYQQLREVLDVEPVPGVPTPPQASDDQIKRLLATLERAGLIKRESVRITAGESTRARLVVRFLIAENDAIEKQRDTCVQNQAATRPPLQADTRTPHNNAEEIKDLIGSGNAQAADPKGSRPPRPPESGKDKDDALLTRVRAREGGHGALAERRTWLGQQGWPLAVLQTASVIALAKDWAVREVPPDVLTAAVDVARQRFGGELPHSPMYLKKIVDELVSEQQRGDDRGRTQGRGRAAEIRPRRLSAAEQAIADAERFERAQGGREAERDISARAQRVG